MVLFTRRVVGFGHRGAPEVKQVLLFVTKSIAPRCTGLPLVGEA